MVMTGAYRQRLGERLRVESAPAIVTRSLRNADMAVTEIRCDHPSPAVGDLIQQEDAFLVGLLLRDFPREEYWGWQAGAGARLAGWRDYYL
jgi:AraC family transcriptional regulator